MTDGDDRRTRDPPDLLDDLLDGADAGRGSAGTGDHGTVEGDEDLAFDLESSEIVAQSFDTEAGTGTRLYRVDDETFALSQYRRSATPDWSETLLAHGSLAVEPVELSASRIRTAVSESDADPLTDAQLEHVQQCYADACEEAIWAAIESAGTNDGPVVRGDIACIEDHAWRDDLVPALETALSEDQAAVVAGTVMDARQAVDWPWCELYAVYVARFAIDPGANAAGG